MHHTFTRLIPWVSLLLTFSVAVAPPASANHVAGATYSGTVTDGGTMEFTVSPDGSEVTNFKAANVPGNVCTFDSSETNGHFPITNHSFSQTSGSGLSFSGTFPQSGTAQGTLRIFFGSPINCDSGTKNWNATKPNNAPVLAAIGNRTVDEGQQLSFTVSATDADGDPLTYSASNLPSGATFDPSTRTFTWRPSCTQAGSYPGVHFLVMDSLGASDFEDITITVNDANCPPSITPIGNKTVAEGATLAFTVSATDPEGDAITYSATNLPSGATFDPGTHQFSWTPTFTQDGSYPGVHFEATDGTHASSEDITITVTNVKQNVTMTLRTKLKPAAIVASGIVKPLRGRVPITVVLFDREGSSFVKVDSAKPKLTAAGAYSATLDRPDGPTCKITARFPGDADYKPKTVTKVWACIKMPEVGRPFVVT